LSRESCQSKRAGAAFAFRGNFSHRVIRNKQQIGLAILFEDRRIIAYHQQSVVKKR
jgi:hypothetical protein